MNNLKETLEQILHPDVEVTEIVPMRRNKFAITLWEESNESAREGSNPLKEVTLIGFDEIYFAANLDKYPFIHGTKDSTTDQYTNCLLIAKHIRKNCDYIIWAKLGNNNIMVVIEMKSKQNKGVPQKFNATLSFIAYLKEILVRFKDVSPDYFDSFKCIPLLINTKPSKTIEALKDSDSQIGQMAYRKGITSGEEYLVKRDFEQIIYN